VDGGVAGLAIRMVAVTPRLHVVVPNWNGAGRLGRCVRSLAAQTHTDFEIVVVDNASADDSIAVLADLAAEIAPIPLTVLRNDVNLGFAGGVNCGIRRALDSGATAIALFNNDAVPTRAGWRRWQPSSTATPTWRSPPDGC
jgi:GT2 family glycosyltransferase